jgi:hypothetical protein
MPGTGKSGDREQVNLVTSLIDALPVGTVLDERMELDTICMKLFWVMHFFRENLD